MREPARAARQPTVLIASAQESSSRSLESILVPSGYHVIKAYTGAQTLERVRTAPPDVILLDTLLPDRNGLELCRELRRDPQLMLTPIITLSSDHVTRQQRIDALRSGAWEQLGAPIDGKQLVLQLEAFARAKLEADRAREEGLLDQATGLYNMRGLARRTRELASQASRTNAALACVVFAPDWDVVAVDAGPTDDAIAAAVDQVANAFKAAGRQADVIGRLGPTEFAVVALGTNAAGSVRLAERLAAAVFAGAEQRGATAARFRLRAGYYAVPDSGAQLADAAETVLRAAAALRLAKSDPGGHWLRVFPDDLDEPSDSP